MCLIIARPAPRPNAAPAIVPPSVVGDSIANGNGDSFGVAYVAGGILETWKGLEGSADEFATLLAFLSDSPFPFLAHMRLSTHGPTNLDNAHPFLLRGGTLAMAHNGILSDYAPAKSARHSDTAELARHLNAFPRKWWRNPAVLRVLASSIGKSNRLAFLDRSGALSFVHEDTGIWDNGIWYANDSYLPGNPRGWGQWTTASTCVTPAGLYRGTAAPHFLDRPSIAAYGSESVLICPACHKDPVYRSVCGHLAPLSSTSFTDDPDVCDLCGADIGDRWA
jgi:hypothetical protein